MKSLFIAWKKDCTRSKNIANHFGAKNIFVCPLDSDGSVIKTIIRYTLSFFSTSLILFKERADIIFTLNQPPFLISIVFLYSQLFGAKYVLDSHSAAFNDPKWAWFRFFYRFIAAKAFFNINTNSYHKSLVESWGGESFVIGDVPIPFKRQIPRRKVQDSSVAIVASFMFDEPLEAVWEAANEIPDVNFHVTGNYKKADKKLIENKPGNIILEGYLSREDYLSLLVSVKGVVALTTRDFTMQMGAYEALSLEMPIITSDWAILRESFGKGAVYVDNSPHSIASGIKTVIDENDVFKQAVTEQRKNRKAQFDETRKKILEKMYYS
jgi:hypothetical protein